MRSIKNNNDAEDELKHKEEENLKLSKEMDEVVDELKHIQLGMEVIYLNKFKGKSNYY